jgi:hypothetical protein
MSDKQPHILIATPMYGGMCTGYYAQSLVGVGPYMTENGVKVSISMMFNESLIQRGRNALADQFLNKTDCTHLMFIDSDIRFNPADILKMLQADKEVICGIYPKKEINWHSVEAAVHRGVPTNELTNYTGALVVNLKDYAGEVTVRVDEPVEIWNGGTGFMLIKREVLEKLKDHVDKYVNNVKVINTEQTLQEIHEFFPVFIDEHNILLSEDFGFCHKARSAGIKIWAAPWVKLGHFGTYLFEGGLIPAP